MTTLKSFADIKPTPEMARAQLENAILRWAVSPHYRMRNTRAGHIVHDRYDVHTTEDLELKLKSLGTAAEKIRQTAAYQAAAHLLCVNQRRPGTLLA